MEHGGRLAITQEINDIFFIFYFIFLALPVVQPLFSSRQEVTPSFSNGAIPTNAVSWPCVRGFSPTHLRMPARAAAGYCVSSFSSPHHVWKIYLSLPMRCPTLAYIHVAAKHVHTPLSMVSHGVDLACHSLSASRDRQSPSQQASQSLASLAPSIPPEGREAVPTFRTGSRRESPGPVASCRGNLEGRDEFKKQSPTSIYSEEKSHHNSLAALR